MALSWAKWLLPAILFNSFGQTREGQPITDPAPHPLYISVTEINHNAQENSIEISCKIFTNDFESTLEKFSHRKVDLSQSRDKTATDRLIAGYIEQHLRLKLNGALVGLQFVGSEKETDATWSYFQVLHAGVPKRIEVTNSILYDTFQQEINIIHVTVGSVRKSTKLNNPKAEASFAF